MNTAYRKPLPGTKLDFFDARAAVDAIEPGAWVKLPYTSRVHAENLVRRCDPDKLTASLKQLIEFGLTIAGTFFISRFIRFVLDEDIYQRFPLPTGIPYAISKLLHYVILVIGFFFAIAALGLDMTKFTILAGAVGVGLGFGMQNIVNNFVSGLILLLERPIQVGDLVEVGDKMGVVKHIGARSTHLASADKMSIIVPNGDLITTKIVNWSLGDPTVAIHVPFNLGVAACEIGRRRVGEPLHHRHADLALYADERPAGRGHVGGEARGNRATVHEEHVPVGESRGRAGRVRQRQRHGGFPRDRARG